MQERLRRFVSDRTLMVAAMSHDLKTPLTRIRLRTELIGDGAPASQDIGRYRRDDGDDRIDARLCARRCEAGNSLAGRPRRTRRIRMRETRSIPDMMSRCRRRGGLFLSTAGPFAIFARPSPTWSTNAVKYGSGTRVRLDRVRGPRLVVTIDDDGPGIPEDETRKKFFAPF